MLVGSVGSRAGLPPRALIDAPPDKPVHIRVPRHRRAPCPPRPLLHGVPLCIPSFLLPRVFIALLRLLRCLLPERDPPGSSSRRRSRPCGSERACRPCNAGAWAPWVQGLDLDFQVARKLPDRHKGTICFVRHDSPVLLHEGDCIRGTEIHCPDHPDGRFVLRPS